MAKNALLLHGTNGTPDGNWLPWLKNQLAWRGFDVAAPQLPEASEPNMARYWEMLASYPFDSQTVIVGHSSGGVAALGVLDRLADGVIVDHVILLGAFYKDEGWNCEEMFEPPLNWTNIKQHVKRIEVWWAPDDSYISEEQTKYICEQLGVEPRIFPVGYGHFNTEVGSKFKQLPELMEAILP